MINKLLICGAAALLSTGCVSPGLGPALNGAALAGIDSALATAVAARQMPGAVFHLEREGRVHQSAQGRLRFDADAPVAMDTVYDVASLTKVLATAPSVLLLVEEGKVALDAPLETYFPAQDPPCGWRGITVRQLLTHTSGLPSGLPGQPPWSGPDAAWSLACSRVATHAPGSFFRYSDVNYILLGRLVETISGLPLERFAERRLFAPLGMRDTGFLPRQRGDGSGIGIAPTRAPEQGPVGEVHDPSTRRMGGVGGAAGVFSTAGDVARFARMLLAGGVHEGVRVLSADSVRLMTTVQTPPALAQARGLGMDIGSPFARPRGALFPFGSYGHTGYTGCFLWVDPQSRSFYVFLSNRVYPDERSNILALYGELGTLSARAVGYGP